MSLHKSSLIVLLTILLVSCSQVDPQESGTVVLSQEEVVESYANEVVFESQFSFDENEDQSLWALNKAEVQEGQVHLKGDQEWGSYLVYLAENDPGSGAVTRFKFSPDAVFSIVLQHGEWNTPDFREIGFGRFDNRLQSTLTVGVSHWEIAAPQRSIGFQPDIWYQAAFFIDDSGAFVITLWPEDNPGNTGLFTWRLAEEDRDLGWRIAVQVHSQSVDVDSITLYNFTALQPAVFPELAALQPITTPQPTLIPTATLIPSPTPLPTQGVGSTMVNLVDNADLVYIPAGDFEMGSDEDRAVEFREKFFDPVDLGEYPHTYTQYLPHVVYTDAYWMYQFEVTNQQYAVFLNEMGNQEQAPYNNPGRGGAWYLDAEKAGALFENDGIWLVPAGLEDHPVIWLDWYGARAYCEWAGGRLPTEAEWEKAARGGLDAKMFPWGDETPVNDPDGQGDNRASYDDKRNGSVPVGSFDPNGFGLYDMAGNVFEFTADWFAYESYINSEVENPQGPAYADRDVDFGLFDRRVVRGGSWYHNQYFLTVWYRGGSYPFSHSDWLGFRCVVDLD